MSPTTSAIDALDYALYICIEAAKERIQNSGELHDYATTQGE
jgi:predicted Abi (CAAX) family protease